MGTPRLPPRKRALEDNFDAFVRQFGGELVEDLLPSNEPERPRNADYLLFDRAVVAELKCLQKDYFANTKAGEKIAQLVNGWMREGLVRPEHIVDGKLAFETLPVQYRERLNQKAVDVFAQPVDDAIKVANSQIKKTRERFGLRDAKGLLIVANDGNYSMAPDLAVSILRDRLRRRFSGIDAYIYFAPGMEITGVERAERVWVHGSAKDLADSVPTEFLRQLSTGWAAFNGCSHTIAVEPDHLRQIGFAAVEKRARRHG